MAGGGTTEQPSDADTTTLCYGITSGHLVINKAKPFHYRVSGISCTEHQQGQTVSLSGEWHLHCPSTGPNFATVSSD